MIPFPPHIVTRASAKNAGLKKYFTGVPCPLGHVVERRVSTAQCTECVRIAVRRYKEENAEALRDKRLKEYVPKPRIKKPPKPPDKQKNCERSKRHYWRNATIMREKQRKLNGTPACKETQRRYRNKNKTKIAEIFYKWSSANQEKVKANKSKRRARQQNAEGSHTDADLVEIRKLQRDRCAMPNCRAKLCGRGDLDHIKPLSRGGSNYRKNLQFLCGSCNARKHAKDPLVFARENGLLL